MTAKQNPCTECGAAGREPHADWCSIGQARAAAARKNQANRKKAKKTAKKAAKKKTTKRRVTKPAPEPVFTNHVAMVMDGSASVRNIRDLIVAAVNNNLGEIKAQSQATGQQTYVTLYTFADTPFPPVFQNVYIHGVGEVTMREYRTGTMTAFCDAIGQAIEDFERLPDVNDHNSSFLIVTATDGQENNSVKWARSGGYRSIDAGRLRTKIAQLQDTERWTFAFTGPRGCKSLIENMLGIFSGNIDEWDNTRRGTEKMGVQVQAGYQNYFAARSAGERNTKQFFTTDMSAVSSTAIANLTDLSSDFKRLAVDNAAPGGAEWQIRHFVEDRMGRSGTFRRQAGTSYQTGRAYYALTKREDVQPSKDILIRDKATGAIYGGHQARGLIGMPVDALVRVTPGNHGNYDIFVKSTSVNRKLVRGTDVLYRVR